MTQYAIALCLRHYDKPMRMVAIACSAESDDEATGYGFRWATKYDDGKWAAEGIVLDEFVDSAVEADPSCSSDQDQIRALCILGYEVRLGDNTWTREGGV